MAYRQAMRSSSIATHRFEATAFSWEECRAGVVGACRPNNGRRQRLRNHVQCSRLERWSDQVLPKNRRHIFRRLENSLPRTKSTTRPRERGVKTTSPVIHRKNAILSVLETFILHLSVTFRFVSYSEIEPSPYMNFSSFRFAREAVQD